MIQALPALTGRTRQFERCSNSRVRPVVGQALSDRSTCRRVGQACPISSWDRSHRTSRDRSDKSVRPVGSCFGRTVPVRPPVEHGCSSTARTAVFDRLMPAVRRPQAAMAGYGLGSILFDHMCDLHPKEGRPISGGRCCAVPLSVERPGLIHPPAKHPAS
ncbi:hypothetical protein PCANC_16121 [Puccinia coronata f. sp. avenae]|uniref:Uncharacterized protein n=1 Tax=Puccinia coronata f. sp. avenae TaxID=200324 RepID=A0A2N5SRX0_9BASI|nr:hypothetical protein PCANC_16121 [Puccinia coronata f. sp. avenae]